MRWSSVERRKLQQSTSCYIKSSLNLLCRLLKEMCWTSQLGLSEKNLKNIAGSQIGSSRAYKRLETKTSISDVLTDVSTGSFFLV